MSRTSSLTRSMPPTSSNVVFGRSAGTSGTSSVSAALTRIRPPTTSEVVVVVLGRLVDLDAEPGRELGVGQRRVGVDGPLVGLGRGGVLARAEQQPGVQQVRRRRAARRGDALDEHERLAGLGLGVERLGQAQLHLRVVGVGEQRQPVLGLGLAGPAGTQQRGREVGPQRCVAGRQVDGRAERVDRVVH